MSRPTQQHCACLILTALAHSAGRPNISIGSNLYINLVTLGVNTQSSTLHITRRPPCLNLATVCPGHECEVGALWLCLVPNTSGCARQGNPSAPQFQHVSDHQHVLSCHEVSAVPSAHGPWLLAAGTRPLTSAQLASLSHPLNLNLTSTHVAKSGS